MSEFQLDIITPEKTYATMKASELDLKTSGGVLGILAHHVDIITDVAIAPITVKYNGHIYYYACSGGVFRFSREQNHGWLYIHSIERADEINVERAEKAKQEAELLMNTAKDKHMYQRAEIRLKRALNRIDVKNRN